MDFDEKSPEPCLSGSAATDGVGFLDASLGGGSAEDETGTSMNTMIVERQPMKLLLAMSSTRKVPPKHEFI